MLIPWKFRFNWSRFWMHFAGRSPIGRTASWLAALTAAPYHGRYQLRYMNPKGYVAPSARFWHEDLTLGAQIFIGDRAIIFQNQGGGAVVLGNHVGLADEVIVETGYGGAVEIGDGSRCQTRCHLSAYKAAIRIGRDVGIGPGCRLIAHNHGRSREEHRKLISKGPIIVDDGAWLGADVKILSGVHIGKNAVVGAGSVVTRDIPEGAVAVGVPARVVKMRSEMAGEG